MVTNAKIINKQFLTVSACHFNTPARKPFPALYAGKRLLASTSSHVPLSFTWAPEPLIKHISSILGREKASRRYGSSCVDLCVLGAGTFSNKPCTCGKPSERKMTTLIFVYCLQFLFL